MLLLKGERKEVSGLTGRWRREQRARKRTVVCTRDNSLRFRLWLDSTILTPILTPTA